MNAFHAHFLDRFSPELLFTLSVGLMLVFIEIGFRLGTRSLSNAVKAQHSQVRAIMGAGLGLTAFMLAFTFATAQSHFEVRVQGMLEEVRLANDAFMQAELMPEPYQGEARRLLRRYMEGRLELADNAREGSIEDLARELAAAERIQDRLWALGVAYAQSDSPQVAARDLRGPFLQAVIGLMDLQTARLEAAIANRIPAIIWFTLYLTGALSMLIMGYQAGLVGRRSPLATVTLAIAFSAVLTLITDLDRPLMRFFEIDNTVVVRLVERMDRVLETDGNG